MPRQARKRSSSGIYHIMLRGINRQIIFEDREDYQRFFDTLKKYKAVSGYTIYAYCLMSNHVHILLKAGQEDLDLIIKRIAGSYVYWYNWKYGRVGHLFQDRFKSEPIETDEYFLTVLRYIHQNPLKANICKKLEDYAYSSYKDYITRNNTFVDTSFAFSILGNIDFEKFNYESTDDACLDYAVTKRQTDKDGIAILYRILNGHNISDIVNFQDNAKREIVKQLKSAGMSIRQISRLTGISEWFVRKT